MKDFTTEKGYGEATSLPHTFPYLVCTLNILLNDLRYFLLQGIHVDVLDEITVTLMH